MDYISIPMPHSKTMKNAKNLKTCRYLVKTTIAAYLIFYKLIFFESLIIFLEPTMKLITGTLICKSNNNFCHHGTSAFSQRFLPKKTRTLMPLCSIVIVLKKHFKRFARNKFMQNGLSDFHTCWSFDKIWKIIDIAKIIHIFFRWSRIKTEK